MIEIRRKKRSSLHTNIAPLVDVVFLLLLFFMVTSRIVAEPAITIHLPKSKTAVSDDNKEIMLCVTEKEELYLGETRISLKDIRSLLPMEFARTGRKMVTIKADNTIVLGLLVKIIDEVKLSDAESFSIVTEREGEI